MINAIIYVLTIICIIIIFVYPFRNTYSTSEYEIENFISNK
jgi:hypothetical protein